MFCFWCSTCVSHTSHSLRTVSYCLTEMTSVVCMRGVRKHSNIQILKRTPLWHQTRIIQRPRCRGGGPRRSGSRATHDYHGPGGSKKKLELDFLQAAKGTDLLVENTAEQARAMRAVRPNDGDSTSSPTSDGGRHLARRPSPRFARSHNWHSR